MDNDPKYWEELWKSDNYEINDGNKELIHEIIKYNIKNKKIIEIGSGRGIDAIDLARLGAEVYVLDYIEEALQITKKLADKENVNLKYILADARKITYENNYFDIVYHAGVLEHFTEPLPLLKEQYRILKKDGMIFVSVPQKFTLYTIRKQFLQLFNRWFAGWETQFSPGKLKKIVSEAGFDVVNIFGYGYYPGFLWRIFEFEKSRWQKIIPRLILKNYTNIMNKFRSTKVMPYINVNVVVVGRKN
jgi:2-polyprenyl-3-methyl-5-hydroxy-6-metoxy-1,4-benzoquinol methylase